MRPGPVLGAETGTRADRHRRPQSDPNKYASRAQSEIGSMPLAHACPLVHACPFAYALDVRRFVVGRMATRCCTRTSRSTSRRTRPCKRPWSRIGPIGRSMSETCTCTHMHMHMHMHTHMHMHMHMCRVPWRELSCPGVIPSLCI